MVETYTDAEGDERCDNCDATVNECVCCCVRCGDGVAECSCDEGPTYPAVWSEED